MLNNYDNQYQNNNIGQHIGTVSLIAFSLMLVLILLPLLDGGFDHQVTYWVLFLLLAVTIWMSFPKKWNLTLDFRHPLLWYSFFVVWSGLSIFWSLNPHSTLVEFLQLTSYGLVFLLASRLNEDNLFRLGRIAWLAGIGAALFGICQYLFLSLGRIAGTFTNANPFGIYLAMIFLLGWGYCLRRPNYWAAVGSIMLLVALFLTGSRGSFIALAVALPLSFWGSSCYELRKKIFKTAILIIIALLITQGIMLLAPVIQETLGRQHNLAAFLTRPESFIASSGVGRFAFWEVAGRLTLNEPLKGYGLGTFYMAYHQGYPGDIWYSRFAHNHYLQVLAELGIVGFSLLLAFLLNIVKRVWQTLCSQSYPNYFPGMLAAMTAFLLHIGVDFSWNFPGAAVVFFAIIGGAVGVSRIKSDYFKAGFRLPRKVVLLSLLIVFILSACQYSAQLLYQHGVKLEMAGDTDGASVVYNRTITFYPINSFYYFNTSRHYYNISLYEADPQYIERSLELLQQAVRFNPANASLHKHLGKLQKEVNNMEEAEKHFLLAMKYAGYRIGMYLDLGWLYLEQERLDDAEKVLLQALELEEVVLKRSGSEPHLGEQLYILYLLLEKLYQETDRDEQATYFNNKAQEMLEEKGAIIYNNS